MKKGTFVFGLVCTMLMSCQSIETELVEPGEESRLAVSDVTVALQQITDDVNTAEVDNIVGSLFGKSRQSRSNDYDVTLFKDSVGQDRIIAINFKDNNGFVLLSAEKTHEPILAYSEEGNFSTADNLPFPLNEWMQSTMVDIAESKSLPADSLQKIAGIWRRYENKKFSLLVDDYPSDHSQLRNLTMDEYIKLSRIMMDHINEWNASGYRVYEIDEYTGTTSLGDKYAMENLVYNRIYPYYMEDYWAITLVIEKDFDEGYGHGRCLKTQWNQEYGYNQSFIYAYDNPTVHIPTGCVPVALGQIMYYNRFPDTYAWDAMSIGYEGNKAASDFLLDVFNVCGAQYEGGGLTGCTTDQLLAALRIFKYDYDFVTKDKITEQKLFDESPAIMLSHLQGKNGDGHAWIIEGGIHAESHSEVEIWTFTNQYDFDCIYNEKRNYTSNTLYYVNWGWGPDQDGKMYNGYYTMSHMYPNNGYTGNILDKAIFSIKPKK